MARVEQAVHNHTSGSVSTGKATGFWRHFMEMLAAMVTGMIATGATFMSVVGLKTWEEVTSQYPTQVLLAMAAGMSIALCGAYCAVTVVAMFGLMRVRHTEYSIQMSRGQLRRFLYMDLMRDMPGRIQTVGPEHAAYWRDRGRRSLQGAGQIT